MAFYDEPQWAVVGDTFPVGCKPQSSIVHVETSFKFNPDMDNDKYKYVSALMGEMICKWKHLNEITFG